MEDRQVATREFYEVIVRIQRRIEPVKILSCTGESGRVMSLIINEISKVEMANRSIAGAVEEQKVSSKQMSRMMSSVSSLSNSEKE